MKRSIVFLGLSIVFISACKTTPSEKNSATVKDVTTAPAVIKCLKVDTSAAGGNSLTLAKDANNQTTVEVKAADNFIMASGIIKRIAQPHSMADNYKQYGTLNVPITQNGESASLQAKFAIEDSVLTTGQGHVEAFYAQYGGFIAQLQTGSKLFKCQ